MWRWLGSTYICVFGLAVTVLATSDVDRFVGQRVTEINFTSRGYIVEDSAARELLETEVGQPLVMREVRESLAHLFSLGRFSGISVDVLPQDGGVALLYELRPLNLVERVEIVGNHVLREVDIRGVIGRQLGEIFSQALVGEVVEIVRGYYGDRGFFTPNIVSQLQERTLVLEVDAGTQARVNRWFITGVASPALNETLRARLGLSDGDFYDGVVLDGRLGEYEAELRERRYYEVQVSHSVESRTDSQIDVRLNISRGPQVTVAFAGDEISEEVLSDLVLIERETSVDEDLLEDADRRIRSYLQSLGFREANVGHTRTETEGQLLIVFTVTRGSLYLVSDVAFSGNERISTDQLRPLVNALPGDAIVIAHLDAGLAAVEERYRRLGFATVRASWVVKDIGTTDSGFGVTENIEQSVVIEIVEGPRMLVGAIIFEGTTAWTFEELQDVLSMDMGGTFYGPQLSADENVLRALYLNEGYEQVVVDVETRFTDDFSQVDVVFRVSEGRQVVVDHVLIVGNNQVDSATIRRELSLGPGDPLGLDDVAESRRRLNALGMFRRLDIREFSHGRYEQRDLIVEVEEAPATSVAYGAGLEVSQRLRRSSTAGGGAAVERIEFAPRGSFQIGRRNLWGKNRSINLFSRVSLRRKNDPFSQGVVDAAPTLGFNEYRLLGTYREPRSFGLGWDILMSGFIEQAIRPSFDLFTRGVTAQVTRQVGDVLSTTVGYRLGENDTSNRQLDLEDSNIVDRLFPEVRLSSFRVSQHRDTRNDAFDPTRGTFISAETELAARGIGSAVGFTKTFLSGTFYRELQDESRFVLATGARVGLAWGFPQAVAVDKLTVARSGGGRRVLDLPMSERFFAGGDTTVRGFALDRLGDPSQRSGGTIASNGFPQGGNAMLVFNSELRIRLTRVLGLVTFLDAGNVYDQVAQMSFRRIRAGAGFGVRYSSPVGPIRVDLGFKLGERYFFGDENNQTLEPLTALHISIGQAF